MTNKIIPIAPYLKDNFHGDIPAPEMLRNIAEQNPKHAFIITWPADGTLPSYHSTTGDVPVIMLRLQEFIHKVYNGEFS